MKQNSKIVDFYDLPFNDKSYDLVSLIEVLEHAENLDKLLQEARRLAQVYVRK